MKTTTPAQAGTGNTGISRTIRRSHHTPKETPKGSEENIKKIPVPAVPGCATEAFIGLPARFWHRPLCARLCQQSLSILTTAASMAKLHRLTWFLEGYRSRRQCADDHREANRQAEAEPLRPLQCPRCYAEFGAPPGWPETICPSCRRETLVPKT